MQVAWKEAVTWDEVLPPSLVKKWQTWFGELSDLVRIKIPRCLKDSQSKDWQRMTVHTFIDASKKTYAAAVYARYKFEDGCIGTRLITARTTFAPLKALSIPRLEPMGPVIGLRLTRKVCEALGVQWNKATCWVDSCNVGYWQIRNVKPFVAHRGGDIHERSNPHQWGYVPKKLKDMTEAEYLKVNLPMLVLTCGRWKLSLVEFLVL